MYKHKPVYVGKPVSVCFSRLFFVELGPLPPKMASQFPPLFLSLVILCLALWRTALGDEFSPGYETYNNADLGKTPTQTFVSNTSIIAPLLQINIWNEKKISPTGGSHIFIRHDFKESAALILDAKDLSVVYVDRRYDRTSDIRIQKDGDQNYLTFYEGPIVDGHGDGTSVMYDDHYNRAYEITAQNLSVKSDLHEFQLTGHGTALVTAYEPVRYNLKPWRGSSRGYMLDGVFQEIDIKTKEILFQWRAMDHVDPSDSYYKVESKWDFFHINSIQKVGAEAVNSGVQDQTDLLLDRGWQLPDFRATHALDLPHRRQDGRHHLDAGR